MDKIYTSCFPFAQLNNQSRIKIVIDIQSGWEVYVVQFRPCVTVAREVYLATEYICHFSLDSLSTDSFDFKSAGCQANNFRQFDI